MPELIQTLKAVNKKEDENRRFMASMQGVELNEQNTTEGPSFEDVRRRALGVNASGDDVVSLQGSFAQQAGFGIGAGLGYSQE
jgi:hypothetical protein